MDRDALRNLLERVADGQLTPAQASERLALLPFESIGFATIDHHRALRCGFPEVIFGEGKSPPQVADIFERLAATGVNVLATRVAPEAAALVRGRLPDAVFHELARVLTLRQKPAADAGAAGGSDADGYACVIAAGTADLPVAEEARLTIEIMDQPVRTLYDVGVSGLHRLLAQSRLLRRANVLVVVAGMEGALPSVVGGLVDVPVLAVPTSVGYGASLGGIAALLGMLTSCASNVSVVNIDNGFGAGYQAAMVQRLLRRQTPAQSTE